MKKFIRSGASLAALGLCVAQALAADEVVITGTRMAAPLQQVVADVVVLEEARIRASGAQTLEELLRREGGIQISRNGGPGQSASILLRGASAASTVVLVDGVRVGSATLGQTDLASISLQQVQRIEVLRGPGSSLYGADAVGGVVHVFTRRAVQGAAWQFNAQAAAGTQGSHEAGAGLSGTVGPLQLAVHLADEGSKGFNAVKAGDTFGLHNPDRDGFSRRSAQLHAALALNPQHRLSLQAGTSLLNSQFDGAEYLPPDYAPDASGDFRSRTRSSQAALSWDASLATHWQLRTQASRAEDDYRSGATQVATYATQRQLLQSQLVFKPSGTLQALVAAEHLVEQVSSSDYAAPQRRNTALVASLMAQQGAHRWQLDARQDRNNQFGAVHTGKLGWALALSPQWSVRGVLGNAYRAPAFNDLYYPGYGVPTLQPERSISAELGLRYSAGTASASATVYNNRVRQLIGYEADPAKCPSGYPFGCAGNVARAQLQGATLEAGHRHGAWRISAALDLLDAKDTATQQRLSRRAPHQERLSVEWAQGPYSASATWLSLGARLEGGAVQAGYGTLDARLAWRLQPQLVAELRASNLANQAHEPVRDAVGAGRQLWLGLRFEGLNR